MPLIVSFSQSRGLNEQLLQLPALGDSGDVVNLSYRKGRKARNNCQSIQQEVAHLSTGRKTSPRQISQTARAAGLLAADCDQESVCAACESTRLQRVVGSWQANLGVTD
jgi:hypothetical protein